MLELTVHIVSKKCGFGRNDEGFHRNIRIEDNADEHSSDSNPADHEHDFVLLGGIRVLCPCSSSDDNANVLTIFGKR